LCTVTSSAEDEAVFVSGDTGRVATRRLAFSYHQPNEEPDERLEDTNSWNYASPVAYSVLRCASVDDLIAEDQ
jgi:hypothetical protein